MNENVSSADDRSFRPALDEGCRRRDGRCLRFLLAVPLALLLALVLASPASGQCLGFDSPGCQHCFESRPRWDPDGSILEVALQTKGIFESCRLDGGQPFYQMQMGLNSPQSAQQLASFLRGVRRSPWCSETIAYWHREAGQPYPWGYETSHRPSWKITNTSWMRFWYLTEHLLRLRGNGGRGRWIESVELDLDDFRPGVNAPCPGAYQQLLAYVPQPLEGGQWGWSGPSTGHSQMVESMTIRTREGSDPGGPGFTIVSFDLKMIEGNSRGEDNTGEVKNSNEYLDVPRYTPAGGLGPDDFIPGTARKIRGWGIDLYPNGEPICDWRRIEFVHLPSNTPPLFPDLSPRQFHDEADMLQVEESVAFAVALQEQGGPRVTVNGGRERVLRRPTAAEPWRVPVSIDEHDAMRVEIGIDYPRPLPYEVAAVELEFAGPKVPQTASVLAQHVPDKSRVEGGGSGADAHVDPRSEGDPRQGPRWTRSCADMTAGANRALLHFPTGVRSSSFFLELLAAKPALGAEVVLAAVRFHPYVPAEAEDSPLNP